MPDHPDPLVAHEWPNDGSGEGPSLDLEHHLDEEEQAGPPKVVGREGFSEYAPEGAQILSSEEDPYIPSDDLEGTMQDNVAEAEEIGTVEFTSNVFPYFGEQDYKSYIERAEDPDLHQDYSASGNFNFGARGAAQGYDLNEIQQIGGVDQAATNSIFNRTPVDYNVDTPAEQYRVSEALDVTSFDEPDDQADIQAGYDYYNCLNRQG